MRIFIAVCLACALVAGAAIWGWLSETPAGQLPLVVASTLPGVDMPAERNLRPGVDDALLDAGAVVGDAGKAQPRIADAGFELGDAASALLDGIELDETFNVLLVGIDKHRGVRKGGRTDTLIVAMFRPEDEQLGLVSVPRDVWVPIEGRDHNRINAVYGLAQLDGKDPLRELERVTGDTLGLHIEHSIAIDLLVFERVIDELGGVVVDVQCPIEDNFLDSRLDGGRRALSLKAGSQLLDGPTAAMYVRSRHGRSDWSRARRQQRVLGGLRDRLSEPSAWTKLPSLLDTVDESIVTRMSRLELLGLARRVLAIDRSKIHGVVLGRTEAVPFRTETNWSVLQPDPVAIRQLLSTLFDAPPPGTRPPAAPCEPADVALLRKHGKATPTKNKSRPE